jgi:hypothetical protein
MATKKELMAEAKALGISGASRMTKDELEEAIDGIELVEAPATEPAEQVDSKYHDLLALRLTADAADEAVQDARRALNKAKANQGDFAQRDRDVAAATKNLTNAQAAAAAARSEFEAAR